MSLRLRFVKARGHLSPVVLLAALVLNICIGTVVIVSLVSMLAQLPTSITVFLIIINVLVVL